MTTKEIRSEGVKMISKRSWFKILPVLLTSGILMLGCMSMLYPPNYYDLGNVSETNNAQIQVFPIYTGYIYNDDPLSRSCVLIDGHSTQWKPPSNELEYRNTNTIVRVTPGEHTFSIVFNPGAMDALTGNIMTKDNSISITYNCKKGMGYAFEFKGSYVPVFKRIGMIEIDESNPLTTPIDAEISIYEYKFNEKGDFKGFKRGDTFSLPVDYWDGFQKVEKHNERIFPTF